MTYTIAPHPRRSDEDTTQASFASYAWVITVDHITRDHPITTDVAGPHDASAMLMKRAKAGEGHVFLIRDPDGVTCYTGRMVVIPGADMNDEEYRGAPLFDFGLFAGGAVGIDWLDHPEWTVG